MRFIVALAATVVIGAAAAAPASAQELPELPKSPAKACAALSQATEGPLAELYSFIATKPGACQSSLASVGLEALAAFAFPSNAAAVGNCKSLEQSTFPAYTPEDGRAYPYQFYWDIQILLGELEAAGVPGAAEAAAYYDSIAPQLHARNRAGCVNVLRAVHGGLMDPVFGFLGSLEGAGA
jgi:hypothetical protein